MIHKPEIRTCITSWVNRLVSPLYEALRIREASLFFCRSGSRQEENFRLDLARINRFCLRPKPWLLIPECRRFYFVEVAYHQPVQLFQSFALHTRIGATSSGVLTEEQVAAHLAIEHGVAGHQVRVISYDLWEPAITAITIFLVSSFTIPRLQQAPNIGRHV